MRRVSLLMLCLMPLILQAKVHKIKFDSARQKSGAKVAIADLNPNLPTDWEAYKYVGIEFRVATSQRFLLGFTTSHGYDELMVHSYCPGQWSRMVIPLIYFQQPPASSHDMASMYNKPRQTGWVNIGGNVGPMTGVDSIGFRQYRPAQDGWAEVRAIELYTDDPGDLYMGSKPALDQFGQSNLISWPGKATTLSQLRRAWQAEDDEVVDPGQLYGYSKYGGYLAEQTEATGFFRREKKDGRWWLVDPLGYRFLSVGVCCVRNAEGGGVRNLEQRHTQGMLSQLPPEKYIRGDWASYSAWNLERRFGPDYQEAATNLTFKRMDKWGVNTIGNWSDRSLEKAGRKAFTCTMSPAGVDGSLFGLGDPYEPGIEQKLEASLRPLMEQYRDNPWLIGYYVGNEPTWLGLEHRVCENLMAGPDRAMKRALQYHLRRRGDSPESRRKFVYQTFDAYLQLVGIVQQRLDPNHMNLGYRFGNPWAVNAEVGEICARHFDVMSFNCYGISPDHKLLDQLTRNAGLPMIIGEFHFGATDHGQGQSLFHVKGQKERGDAYRYYVEQGFSHPGLVGVTYFTWNDQDILGRFDGENYNCGLVDVTLIPYRHQTEAMMQTARRLRAVHAGQEAPFADRPEHIVGMERGNPNEW